MPSPIVEYDDEDDDEDDGMMMMLLLMMMMMMTCMYSCTVSVAPLLFNEPIAHSCLL